MSRSRWRGQDLLVLVLSPMYVFVRTGTGALIPANTSGNMSAVPIVCQSQLTCLVLSHGRADTPRLTALAYDNETSSKTMQVAFDQFGPRPEDAARPACKTDTIVERDSMTLVETVISRLG